LYSTASAVLHAAEEKLEHAAEGAAAAAGHAASAARHAVSEADEAAKRALAPVLAHTEEDYQMFNAHTTGVPHDHQVCSSAKHAHAPEACPAPPT